MANIYPLNIDFRLGIRVDHFQVLIAAQSTMKKS